MAVRRGVSNTTAGSEDTAGREATLRAIVACGAAKDGTGGGAGRAATTRFAGTAGEGDVSRSKTRAMEGAAVAPKVPLVSTVVMVLRAAEGAVRGTGSSPAAGDAATARATGVAAGAAAASACRAMTRRSTWPSAGTAGGAGRFTGTRAIPDAVLAGAGVEAAEPSARRATAGTGRAGGAGTRWTASGPGVVAPAEAVGGEGSTERETASGARLAGAGNSETGVRGESAGVAAVGISGEGGVGSANTRGTSPGAAG